jgi:hypothetical protein
LEFHFFRSNLVWSGLGLNLSLWGEMLSTDCRNRGMVIGFLYELNFVFIIILSVLRQMRKSRLEVVFGFVTKQYFLQYLFVVYLTVLLMAQIIYSIIKFHD